MSHSSGRGFRGKNALSNDRNQADLPENFGNRRTFEEMRIPPDNVGNKIENDPIATFIHDGLGNSLDEEPAHLKSGILTHLLGSRERISTRRFPRDQHLKEYTHALPPHQRLKSSSAPIQGRKEQVRPRVEVSPVDTLKNGEAYMASLAQEFTKLLSEKSGLPFSFSMKPVSDPASDPLKEREYLASLKSLIEEILKSTLINASVSTAQYHTNRHRFAVFFVNPSERDPARNKELISALRQIVKLHSQRFPPGAINVLLVLANAETLIEGHLYKIGAKKV